MITKNAVMACSPTQPVPLVFALLVKMLVEPASSSSAAAGVIVLEVEVVVFEVLFRFRCCCFETIGFSACMVAFPATVDELRNELTLVTSAAEINANSNKLIRTTIDNCCILYLLLPVITGP